MPECPERKVPITIIGVGNCKNLSEIDQKIPGSKDDAIDILKEDKVGVAANYLPVGSKETTK